jgi:tRNA G10  N-methylase Trm11
MILGRQPALGLAELESLYGAQFMRLIDTYAVLLNIEPSDVSFNRLGGSVKLTKVLNELPTVDWRTIENYLLDSIPDHLDYLPAGKLKLGISVYGLKINPKHLNATGLKLKKIIKTAGRSVRIVPSRSPHLNSAQVLHNQLTSELGWELVIVRDGNKILLCQAVAEQDIEAYAARDQKRPMRDPKVGMLPPKLAQIIINLATAEAAFVKNKVINAVEETYERPFDILDPFCGTGVILQEALLMGYSVLGSDKDILMAFDYASENLIWLKEKWQLKDAIFEVYHGDATTLDFGNNFRTIACETYLGKPLSQLPSPTLLDKIISEVNELHYNFLENIARQTKKGFRMCIAVPAWKTKTGFRHLPTLDKLSSLGYNRIDFVHSRQQELIYHRPDQIVARELVVLERN